MNTRRRLQKSKMEGEAAHSGRDMVGRKVVSGQGAGEADGRCYTSEPVDLCVADTLIGRLSHVIRSMSKRDLVMRARAQRNKCDA
jgi:hypothetical protein